LVAARGDEEAAPVEVERADARAAQSPARLRQPGDRRIGHPIEEEESLRRPCRRRFQHQRGLGSLRRAAQGDFPLQGHRTTAQPHLPVGYADVTEQNALDREACLIPFQRRDYPGRGPGRRIGGNDAVCDHQLFVQPETARLRP